MPPLVALPITSSKCRKTELITQGHVTTLPSLYHPQIHTVLLSATQPASISPHTPPPPHSQYIQPLSRVPTGIDLPTYLLPFLFSLPTITVRGRGVRGLCVIFRQGYLWREVSVKRASCVIFRQGCLWRESSVKRASCVQCQPTVSAVCDVIFLRDNGNDHCELLVVIMCCHHLIPNAFHPLLLVSLVEDCQMHCGITFL